jgi:expansin (peptidoglycan-binding protein)
MKMLSPLRAGLALSMLGAAIFGCDDGSMSDGGVGAAAGTTGAGASAGVGGTAAAGAAGGTGGATSGAGGTAGSTAAGGSIGNGGSAGNVSAGGSAGSVSAGGSAGSVGAGGAAGSGGSGGTGNDAPAPVVPGTCKSDLGGYQTGWVTWYTFSQGTELVHCSWGTHKAGNGTPDKVDHVLTGNGTYFGAINTSDYESAATCGACVEVSRTDQNKKVTITIVDECPIGSNDKCVAGHIDLSQEAFKQLGDTSEGYLGSGKPGSKGQISWKYVPCPTGETVHFALKEPSNVNWNQIVVSGNQYEIVKLEVRVNGTWVNAAREVYNYWQTPDGKMGASPYRVRVTDVNGSVLEADVPLAAGDYDSGVQFTCN